MNARFPFHWSRSRGTLARACLALAFVSAPTAFAVTSINWTSTANAIRQSSGANAPSTWTAQLVWSPDNIASPPAGSDPFGLTEGEVELVIGPLNVVNVPGRIIKGSLVFADAFVGGFVYTRVYDIPFAEVGSRSPSLFGTSAASGPLVLSTVDPNSLHTHRPDLSVSQPVSVPLAGTLVLYGNGLRIENGDTTPEPADHTHFGSTYQSGAPLQRTFQLLNVGTGPLDLVSIQVPSGFTLDGFAPATLNGGDALSIPVLAGTASSGAWSGVLTVNYDNGTALSYSFSLAADIRDRPRLTPVLASSGSLSFAWPVGELSVWRLTGSSSLAPGASWSAPAGTTVQEPGRWRFLPAPGQPLPSYLRLETP